MGVKTLRPDQRETIAAALTRILMEGNSVHRCHAAQALGRMEAREAVAPLVERLRDEDVDVCVDAATALGRIADPAAADALLAAVRERDPAIAMEEGWDPWWDVQRQAIAALAAIGDSRAVPALTAALDDPGSQDLSETVLPALARLGDEGLAALLGYLEHSDSLMRRRALSALLESGAADRSPDAAGAVRSLLVSGDADARAMLVAFAEQRGSLADVDLIALSQDGEAAIHLALAAPLGRRADDRHRARLRAMVTDPDPQVRKKAVEVLGEVDGGALPWLRHALDDARPTVAVAAAEALGRMASPEARDVLSGLAGDPDRAPELRAAALRALASHAPEDEALERLFALFADGIRDGSRLVRMVAITSLPGLRHPRAEALLIAALRGELLAAPDGTDMEIAAETPHGEPEAPFAGDAPAADSVDDGDGPRSTLEAVALDNAAVSAAMPAETGPMAAPEEAGDLYLDIVREHLAVGERLLRRREPAPHQDVRLFAARAAGAAEPSPALREALLDTLADPDAELRAEALRALGLLGLPGTVPFVLPHLNSAAADEAMAAAETLGRLGDPAAVLPLLWHLEAAAGPLRSSLARALCAFAGDIRARPRLVELLGDPAPTIRLVAAESLAAAGIREALPQLAAMSRLDEGSQRREVGRLLGRLDPTAATEFFLQRLDDPAWREQRRVSIDVLAELAVPMDGPSPHELQKSQGAPA